MKTGHFISAVLLFLILIGCALTGSHLQRGKYFLEKKRYEKAITELEKASKDEGDIYYYIDTYVNLGNAYHAHDQKLKAISVYRTAVQMIHLKMREISARRLQLRRELTLNPPETAPYAQEEDMLLANDEVRLKKEYAVLKKRLRYLMKE